MSWPLFVAPTADGVSAAEADFGALAGGPASGGASGSVAGTAFRGFSAVAGAGAVSGRVADTWAGGGTPVAPGSGTARSDGGDAEVIEVWPVPDSPVGSVVPVRRGPADTAVLDVVVCDDREMSGVGPAPAWVRLLRAGFAVLGVIALAWSGTHLGGQSPADHYSYFTIQSNVMAVLVLLAGGLLDPQGRVWQQVRGAVTLYLVITGIVYAVLLAHLESGDRYPWVNDVLHRAMPIVLLLDWVVVPAALGLTARLVAMWLLYPVGYGGYSLVRGLLVDWYPYPFLNPVQQGYLSMSLGLIVLVGVFSLLAVAVVALGDLAVRLHRPAPR
ncbi:Pr6Pr family membrane protein [Nocardia aurantia]|uniref:Pr6Pr family membrane protein n=1 Tax=Nocardia aurantia TaxID=2585199 RepID=UPI0029E7E37A|nr:Pr6Pr family membrane protein [Nocardia aurantia]